MTPEELEKNIGRFRKADQLRVELRAAKECLTHLLAIAAGGAKIGIEFYELPHGTSRKAIMHTSVSNQVAVTIVRDRVVELNEEFERL